MKHIRTITNKQPQKKDMNFAVSCKTSVTLCTNFNSEKHSEEK